MSRLAPLAVALSLLLTSCSHSEDSGPAQEKQDDAALTVSWERSADAPFPGAVTGEVVVPASGGAALEISLTNARFTALPDACIPSTIVGPKSRLVADNAQLRCDLAESEQARTVEFAAVAVGAPGDEPAARYGSTATRPSWTCRRSRCRRRRGA